MSDPEEAGEVLARRRGEEREVRWEGKRKREEEGGRATCWGLESGGGSKREAAPQ